MNIWIGNRLSEDVKCVGIATGVVFSLYQKVNNSAFTELSNLCIKHQTSPMKPFHHDVKTRVSLVTID